MYNRAQIDFPREWQKQLAEQDRRFLFPRDKKGYRGENPWQLFEAEFIPLLQGGKGPRNRYDFVAFYT